MDGKHFTGFLSGNFEEIFVHYMSMSEIGDNTSFSAEPAIALLGSK
jgi:hypothetical protein